MRKSLILKIFDSAYMQRWNDHLRPFELVELDKQGHKMFIAYFIGKYAEGAEGFDWVDVIEGAIFDLLQRIVITDIKPPVFYRIKSDSQKYRKLNDFVISELHTIISSMGNGFVERFKKYLNSRPESISYDVLDAAHNYASYWEFLIIEKFNSDMFEIDRIKNDFIQNIKKYEFLEGANEIESCRDSKKFIDICGRLRFQSRWAQLHRIPRTSVLGHSAFVAMLSYLFSLEIGACRQRRVNNFFSGLFHDLPEVFTRDIVSPVKRSIEGLEELIREIETENMENIVYPLLSSRHSNDIRRYLEDEFCDDIVANGKRVTASTDQIQQLYNEDRFSPRDGTLVKAADKLAAFVEAHCAIQNGCASMEFRKAALSIKSDYEGRKIGGFDIGSLYEDF